MVNLTKVVALGAALITSASAHTFKVFENADCTSNQYSIEVRTVPDADTPCTDFPPKFKNIQWRSVMFSEMNTCRFRFASGTDQCKAKKFKNSFDSGAEDVCIQIPASWTSIDVTGCPPVPPSKGKSMRIAEVKPEISVIHW